MTGGATDPDRCGPDFVVIGAMKAGTTSVHRWLGRHPHVWLPDVKEPGHFAATDPAPRDWDRYLGLFDAAPPGARTGEASTVYTSAAAAERSARAMHAALPDLRLVYLYRDPLDRLRSHYRHERQRGRERRSLADAVSSEANEYVGQSLYRQRLEPYLRHFPPEQLFVVSIDELHADASRRADLLEHLGLDPGADDGPLGVDNVTADKQPMRNWSRWVYKRGLLSAPGWLPGWARRAGRRAAFGTVGEMDRIVDDAAATLPEAVREAIDADHAQFLEYVRAGA